MLRPYSRFDRSTPEKLQGYVPFVIKFYMYFRGREWMRYVIVDKFMTDSDGKVFVDISALNSKNEKPSIL